MTPEPKTGSKDELYVTFPKQHMNGYGMIKLRDLLHNSHIAKLISERKPDLITNIDFINWEALEKEKEKKKERLKK